MKTIAASNTLRYLLGGFLLLALTGLPAAAQPGDPPPGAVGYDIERKEWLYDTDGDTFPDLTEEIGGTDPKDKNSNPLALLEAAAREREKLDEEEEKVGFTRKACRSGFISVPGATNLCISQFVQDPANYTLAQAVCRDKGSRLCTYEDLGYIYLRTSSDATYNAAGGRWLGDFVNDNQVNCGNFSVTFNNDPDIWDFEGFCGKAESHNYWCCHDRDPLHAAP